MIDTMIAQTVEATVERTLQKVIKILDERLPGGRSDDTGWMGVNECAAYLCVHRNTAGRKLREWEKNGAVPIGRIAGKLRVRRADIDAHLLSGKSKPKPSPAEVAKRILEK